MGGEKIHSKNFGDEHRGLSLVSKAGFRHQLVLIPPAVVRRIILKLYVLNWAHFLTQGMPCKKIALGLGTYGRAFTLANPSQRGLGAPAKGPASKGKYTREAGFLSYYEICAMGLTVVRDNAVQAPYGFKGDQWVGYDDVESLTRKVNTLIKGKHLLGAMFWALDLDDFKGSFCGEGR